MAAGLKVGRDQISRLRKELGIVCVQKKKYRATTDSSHSLAIAPNLLMQDFRTTAPGQVWGGDITYVWTPEGWLYLAGVKDFFTREIVGYAMASAMTEDLVRRALVKAVEYRKPGKGCIFHSDRGSQYCSGGFQSALRRCGLRSSMSRKGNCYDNAPTESFWAALKQELIYPNRFQTRAQAESAIRQYIELFYNRIRRHTALGNLPPAIYAANIIQRRSA
jgi:transposase InsO family protein